MSVTPRGMSVQEAYRYYRDEKLLVNRRYQRKLVWTEKEKVKLIDSMMKGFPVPLILLAEHPKGGSVSGFEIIDGVQRLNAIFSFIENAFVLEKRYFDIREFARAKQFADAGVFVAAPEDAPRLTRKECADLLDYQLAVTIYPTSSEDEITEVFGRINSGGRQLSDQEKRQAGVVSPFAELVRKVASELRGDPSKEVLLLSEMPEISIGSRKARQGYGLTAEDTFWCKQGVLWINHLRDSEDEEMVADIAASILLDAPFARSKERYDELYDSKGEMFEKIGRALVAYPAERVLDEIKVTFSVLREVIETYSPEPYALRNVVNPGSRNPIRGSFYAVFMAFFKLVVREELSPADEVGIMTAIKNLQEDMERSRHYTTIGDRTKNIDKTVGLIQKFFVKKEPPVLRHGPGLALDFENSLRRSSIETPRYEFKQGLIRLSAKREFDDALLPKIVETICGIANIGPNGPGYIYVGVADKKEDAEQIGRLDRIHPVQVGQRYVVGVDREVAYLKINLEGYQDKILNAIRSSKLSDPLKRQLLTQIDVIEYKGMSVIRILVPAQTGVSFVGEDAFIRDGSSTVLAKGRSLLAINELFSRK